MVDLLKSFVAFSDSWHINLPRSHICSPAGLGGAVTHLFAPPPVKGRPMGRRPSVPETLPRDTFETTNGRLPLVPSRSLARGGHLAPHPSPQPFPQLLTYFCFSSLLRPFSFFFRRPTSWGTREGGALDPPLMSIRDACFHVCDS